MHEGMKDNRQRDKENKKKGKDTKKRIARYISAAGSR